jgi:uncharacterized membrane protein
MPSPSSMVPEPTPLKPPLRAWAVASSVAFWAALLVLLRLVPPDGREHGNLGQFLGRFHPLLVHGPIAMLALVPLMEVLGRIPRWSHLRPAAGWLLTLTAFATYFTAADGWLLGWSGGYRGHDLTNHMWAGGALAVVCGLAALARGRRPAAAYPVLLAGALALLVIAGHIGGTISHGEGFLTDKLPARVRGWLGMPAAPVEAKAAASGAAVTPATKGGPASMDPGNPAFYAIHIAPLFARSCNSCHRPEKHKGGLRLDTYLLLMHGGSDGKVVVPGDPQGSEIIRRVILPASDDDFMPSDDDKPLSTDEIQMLEHWIAAGAKG